MSDQRSVGIHVLTSDPLKQYAVFLLFTEISTNYEQLEGVDYVSVYSTKLDEDVLVDEEAETYHDENAMIKVRTTLSLHFSDKDVDLMIRSLHRAGILFRELVQD